MPIRCYSACNICQGERHKKVWIIFIIWVFSLCFDLLKTALLFMLSLCSLSFSLFPHCAAYSFDRRHRCRLKWLALACVKHMERDYGTHHITQYKSAIVHYFKIRENHCRQQAELTFCAVTWWWFNELLSFTSHSCSCRFCRCLPRMT